MEILLPTTFSISAPSFSTTRISWHRFVFHRATPKETCVWSPHTMTSATVDSPTRGQSSHSSTTIWERRPPNSNRGIRIPNWRDFGRPLRPRSALMWPITSSTAWPRPSVWKRTTGRPSWCASRTTSSSQRTTGTAGGDPSGPLIFRPAPIRFRSMGCSRFRCITMKTVMSSWSRPRIFRIPFQ